MEARPGLIVVKAEGWMWWKTWRIRRKYGVFLILELRDGILIGSGEEVPRTGSEKE